MLYRSPRLMTAPHPPARSRVQSPAEQPYDAPLISARPEQKGQTERKYTAVRTEQEKERKGGGRKKKKSNRLSLVKGHPLLVYPHLCISQNLLHDFRKNLNPQRSLTVTLLGLAHSFLTLYPKPFLLSEVSCSIPSFPQKDFPPSATKQESPSSTPCIP